MRQKLPDDQDNVAAYPQKNLRPPNPIGRVSSDDGTATDPGTDPSTENRSFLFDPVRNIIANQFMFTPGETPADDRAVVNNLPSNGVGSDGNFYSPRAGVIRHRQRGTYRFKRDAVRVRATWRQLRAAVLVLRKTCTSCA